MEVARDSKNCAVMKKINCDIESRRKVNSDNVPHMATWLHIGGYDSSN